MASQEKPVTIVIIQGLLMLGIWLAPLTSGLRIGEPHGVLGWFSLIVFLFGVFFVVTALWALGKTFTVHADIKPGTEFKKRFPFTYSRNPTYFGGLLMCFSWSLAQRSWLAGLLSVALATAFYYKIQVEERNLERAFGASYLEYKKTVGRFIGRKLKS